MRSGILALSCPRDRWLLAESSLRYAVAPPGRTSLGTQSPCHTHFHKSIFHPGKQRSQKAGTDVHKVSTFPERGEVNGSPGCSPACSRVPSSPHTLRCIQSAELKSSHQSPWNTLTGAFCDLVLHCDNVYLSGAFLSIQTQLWLCWGGEHHPSTGKAEASEPKVPD